jgi:hypothetical protein
MPVRPTRVGRAAEGRSDTDHRTNRACIERGICGCDWGCIPYRPAWADRGTVNPECAQAGVCVCGWGVCEPIQHMPTLNDALQLRTLWNSSADLLMSRLLQLDRLSERIGLGGSITDEFVAHNGTVEQWKSFLKYLIIEREAAWVRHELERQAAWDASGFFR